MTPKQFTKLKTGIQKHLEQVNQMLDEVNSFEVKRGKVRKKKK